MPNLIPKFDSLNDKCVNDGAKARRVARILRNSDRIQRNRHGERYHYNFSNTKQKYEFAISSTVMGSVGKGALLGHPGEACFFGRYESSQLCNYLWYLNKMVLAKVFFKCTGLNLRNTESYIVTICYHDARACIA
jgi:hypothetical protein